MNGLELIGWRLLGEKLESERQRNENVFEKEQHYLSMEEIEEKSRNRYRE